LITPFLPEEGRRKKEEERTISKKKIPEKKSNGMKIR
jgi:hypothetical protein